MSTSHASLASGGSAGSETSEARRGRLTSETAAAVNVAQAR